MNYDLFHQEKPAGIFYDTINSSKQEKVLRTMKAGGQMDTILTFFQQHKEEKFTTVEVSEKLKLNLNSTRRAMTDLQKKWGLLEMLDEMKDERYGKPNHLYKLKLA